MEENINLENYYELDDEEIIGELRKEIFSSRAKDVYVLPDPAYYEEQVRQLQSMHKEDSVPCFKLEKCKNPFPGEPIVVEWKLPPEPPKPIWITGTPKWWAWPVVLVMRLIIKTKNRKKVNNNVIMV